MSVKPITVVFCSTRLSRIQVIEVHDWENLVVINAYCNCILSDLGATY